MAYETLQITHGCALFRLYELHSVAMNIAHLVIPLLLPGFHAYPWQTARKPPGQPNESAVGESKRVLPGFQLPGVSCLGKGTQHMVLFGEAESKHRPESLQGGGFVFVPGSSLDHVYSNHNHDVRLLSHAERLPGWPKAYAIRTDPPSEAFP